MRINTGLKKTSGGPSDSRFADSSESITPLRIPMPDTGRRATGRMGRLLAWLVLPLLAVSLSLRPAAAALVGYGASGGRITGTLGGIAFTDASWTVSGLTSDASVQSGMVGGIVPFVYNYVTPMISIFDGTSGTLTAQLLNGGGFSWAAVSIDYGSIGADLSINGFVFLDSSASSGSGFAVQTTPAQTSDLIHSTSISGSQLVTSGETYSTSVGDLAIAGDIPLAANFTVADATDLPLPGTVALLAIGGLVGRRRRRRSA